MKIGVLAAENSWHFQDLKRAAAMFNACEVHSLSFERLAGSVGSNDGPRFASGQSDLRRLDLQMFDRLLVRTMPSGSLQQIIFRMDLLNRLEAAGTRVINAPRAMEISVDKYLSLAILADAGMAVPRTVVSQSLDSAMADFQTLGGDVIYKPLFGSMGNGIVRLQDEEEARRCFAAQIAEGQVIYQQTFIEHGDSDIRLLVIGDDVIGMRRVRPGHWLTNIAQGAIGEPYHPTDQQRQLAVAACRAVGCQIAGIDLLIDAASGTNLIVDVNAAPGWKAIAEVTSVDVAKQMLIEVMS